MEKHTSFRAEREAEGKYRVYSPKPYPALVGYITGGGRTWLAERGLMSLGYFKSKREAVSALVKATEGALPSKA